MRSEQIRQIPREVKRAIQTPPTPFAPVDGERFAVVRGKTASFWLMGANGVSTALWIDAVGIPHETDITRRVRGEPRRVATWEKMKTDWHGEESEDAEKVVTIVDPYEAAFPATHKWKLGSWQGLL